MHKSISKCASVADPETPRGEGGGGGGGANSLINYFFFSENISI